MTLVEVLYVDNCGHWQETLAEVEEIVQELAVDAEVRAVRVGNPEEAERLRFLGSPTVRVDGRDIEPGGSERRDWALACRVYKTEAGLVGRPPEEWIRAALIR